MASKPNKTFETDENVADYLTRIQDDKKRADCSEIINLIAGFTALPPKMWGTGIVGFGSYHYKYESGREGDAPLTGIAARANAIVLYLSGNFEGRDELLQQFGKHKTSKGCVYIQKLEDIDTNILGKMVQQSVKHVRELYSDK